MEGSVVQRFMRGSFYEGIEDPSIPLQTLNLRKVEIPGGSIGANQAGDRTRMKTRNSGANQLGVWE